MRVALVSFEFPPSIAVGGIGAYTRSASIMLSSAGHDVVVFCGGKHDASETDGAVVVYRFSVGSRRELAERIVQRFVQEHEKRPFDVVEGPDVGPEADLVMLRLPTIARVVRLHTPSYLVARVGFQRPSLIEKFRFAFGALRRGRLRLLPNSPCPPPALCLEREQARIADEVVAISKSIRDIVIADWRLDCERVSVIPNPFVPSEEILSLPLPSEIRVIGFLGRMEVRKGIVEFAKAVSIIAKIHSNCEFHFIGPSWPYRSTDMKTWLEESLKHVRGRLTFHGQVAERDVPKKLAICDAIVLPSRWENFPYACAESMAAGRVVIGSSAGGMAEMIEHGVTGLLVTPGDPRAIAKAIMQMVRSPGHAIEMAAAGRLSIQQQLSPIRICALQIASYERAIHRAAMRNSNGLVT